MTSDWHPHTEETPTCELRIYEWSTDGGWRHEKLQQKWKCREGDRCWDEWRDLPRAGTEQQE